MQDQSKCKLVNHLSADNSVSNIDLDSTSSIYGDYHQNDSTSKKEITANEKPRPYQMKIVWFNVILMAYLHLSAACGIYLFFFVAKYSTCLFQALSTTIIGIGVTAGAHRLWAHRSYEASLFLRIILMLLNSASLQNDIYEWCRDHRVHHKFSETDADPHNSKRGFFFAHMGWLLCRKHPDVIEKGRTVSLADLERDNVVRFQRKFYKPLAFTCTFILPTWIPYYFWNENIFISYFVTLARYTFSLHCTWLVNSLAHLYGTRPYDTTINPVESPYVQFLALGEGYHNYHHVFPYDYSASEMTWTYDFNFSTCFIDLCAWLGLAWNLKKVDKKTIMKRIKRTGDQTMVEVYHQQHRYSLWKHTIFPLLLFFAGSPFGPFVVRKVCSAALFWLTGIPDYWT